MREIKFRGRISGSLENAGQWIYWGVGGTDKIDVIDPETIGQFTGLFDKNGVEIYEGDILQFEYPEGDIHAIGPVKWREEVANYGVIDLNVIEPEDCFVPDIYEVIGDIYQDAHLLESEK